MLVSYARASKPDQKLDLQRDTLTTAWCGRAQVCPGPAAATNSHDARAARGPEDGARRPMAPPGHGAGPPPEPPNGGE